MASTSPQKLKAEQATCIRASSSAHTFKPAWRRKLFFGGPLPNRIFELPYMKYCYNKKLIKLNQGGSSIEAKFSLPNPEH
jgi:hypothetical protein